MQFAIFAYDGDDPHASARRDAARPEHLAGLKREKIGSTIIDAGAILNEAGGMIESVVLCEVPDRDALNRYIAEEPYVRDGIWKTIFVYPIQRVDWPALLTSG